MSNIKGYIFIIISGILFGSMPLFAKIFYNNGCTPLSLVFYRFFISLPFLYLITMKLDIDLRVTKKEIMDLILISVFGYSATAGLLYLSYNFIPSGLSTSLHFIYPVLITIACIAIYKEKLNFTKIFCAFLCTLGIFLFLHELDLNEKSYIGILLAAASGFTYSYYMIALERSSVHKMHTFKVVFYLCLISSVVLLVYNLILGTFAYNFIPSIWAGLVLFALLITIGAVSLFQKGLSIIGAQNTSILSTTEPITSVIIGIFLFGEPSNLKVILGILSIVLSVVLLSINDKRKEDVKVMVGDN